MSLDLRLKILPAILTVFASVVALPAHAQPDAIKSQLTRFFDDDSVTTGDLVTAAKQSMMGDPEQALRHAQSAETLARRAPASARQKFDIATAFWLQAEALLRLNRAEEAAPLIDRAIILIGNRKTSEKLGGDLMLARGRVARENGDIEEALKSYQEAHDIFAELEVRRSQAIALQSIGSVYADAQNYERVIEYYKRSAEVFNGDPALDMSAENNLANAYKDMGEYENAIIHFNEALQIAEGFNSPILTVRILTNLASVQALKGEIDAAAESVARGLALSAEANNDAWEPFLWGVQANIDYSRGEIEKAKASLELLFEDMDLETTTFPYKEFHVVAVDIYEASGDLDLALAHMKALKRLDDLSLQAAASANVALMGAEFDFASQQLQIEKLRTGQLQRDMELSRARDRQQVMLTVFVALISILVVGALSVGYISLRRSRNSIRVANAELQRSHRELEASNAALEKANNAKTEFLATTSHEIRTPLNGILGLTEVILKNNELQRADRERLEMIGRAGKALLCIVNDILDVAKIESGRMKVMPGPVYIQQSVRETIDLWRENAEGKGLAVRSRIDDLPELIEADEKYIRQIVFNLLSNAVKFTESGTIEIEGWTEQSGDGETFLIRVKDSGIGIPEHELENIFKTFQQVDTGSSRKYGGTGLGLSICLKLARLMDGDLIVDSSMGDGSSFTLSLPLKRLQSPAAERGVVAEECDTPSSLKQLDVLVAEDNKVNQIVIESLLKDCVRSVDIVDDGNAALEAIKVKQYDLVLMDKQMPVMDGIAATSAIRNSDRAWRDIYIIAVTADAFDGAREDLLAKGMDDYLAKPVNQDALVEVMKKAIDRSLVHRRVRERQEA